MKRFYKRKCQAVTCHQCHGLFDKPISDIKRNLRIGINNFCSRNCSVKYAHVVGHYRKAYKTSHKNLPRRLRDEFSPFRRLLGSCNRRFNDFSLTLVDVKNQWDKQKGVCPYTGIKLSLDTYSSQASDEDKMRQASLDRIDSTKGYAVGNVEFIAMPINYMKHDFSKDVVLNFLKKISLHWKDKIGVLDTQP